MRKLFAISTAFMLASTAWAQDEAEEVTAEEIVEEQPVEEAPAAAEAEETEATTAPAAPQAPAQGATPARASTPQEITRAVHSDWQIRCITGEQQQCYLYQLVVNQQNAPLMEFSLVPARDETGGDVKMVATLITPLNTVLGRGVIMQVDENNPVKKDYTWCAPIGCFVRYPVDSAELASYKSGGQILTAFFMMQNPNVNLELPLSLTGFGAAYDELMEIEAEE